MTKEKKKATILGRIILGLMLFTMMVVPAMATGTGPLPPDEGTLVIHKYLGDTTTLDHDGTVQDVPSDRIPVNGVAFDIYQVTLTGNATPPAGPNYSYRIESGRLVVNDGTVDLTTTYAVVAVPTNPHMTTTHTTYGPGTIELVDLDQGVYLVIENTTASNPVTVGPAPDYDTTPATITTPCKSFLVAVPMTNPDGDGWMETVHVYPKNESMSVEKSIDDPPTFAVQVGDVLDYIITVTVPADVADGQGFLILDNLDAAFTLNTSSVKVYARPVSGPDEELINNVPPAVIYYIVTYDTSGTNNQLKVELTTFGMADLEGFDKVVVTFSVTVNDKLYDKIDSGDDINIIGNEASVDFWVDPTDHFTPNTNGGGPEVYTAGIRLAKINDATPGVALTGAKFKISDSQDNARDGKFIRKDADGVLHAPDTTGWDALTAADDYELAVNASGIVYFMGLLDYTGPENAPVPQTYWFVETQAPDGYNLLANPFSVTFSSASDTTHVQRFDVVNSTGFTLPSTGGIGTIIFTVAGIVLIGTAVIVALSRKRKTRVTR